VGFERRQIRPLLDLAEPILARGLGRTADDADMATEIVLSSFSVGELPMANFITDGLLERCLLVGYRVDFAAIDASAIHAGLPAGSLTYGDWFNVMPYADTVRIFELSGYQVRSLLADNARRFALPGQFRGERGFLQFSKQVRYAIVLDDEGCTGCADEIEVFGSAIGVQLERTFRMACTSFTRQAAAAHSGGSAHRDSDPDLLRCLPYVDTGLYVRDELIARIRQLGGVTGEGGARRDGRLRVIHKSSA
jgi:5'-nucleotidase/5'-nucleotidase/UDP-sugar diphosphatase